MDVDNNFSRGASRESHRLDVWIDHRPLTCPVAAHAIPSMNVPTLHPIGPRDIRVHCRENALHGTSVEPVINMFEKFHFVGHSISVHRLPTNCNSHFRFSFKIHCQLLSPGQIP